jgi:hypothetical protein
MGSCKISFDAIKIINRKSDSNHSDNDRMVAFWFVNYKRVPDGGPVLFLSSNESGNAVLESCQPLEPIRLELPCNDGDLLTVVYSIANFGSTDFQSRRPPQKKLLWSRIVWSVGEKGVGDSRLHRHSPEPCGRLPVARESVSEVRSPVKQGCLAVVGPAWMAMSEVACIVTADVMQSSPPRHGQKELMRPSICRFQRSPK